MRLIAHRGFAGENPENTLVAVRRAAQHADMIEIDVRRCGSGELVVIHDESVDRVTDGTGLVADLPLSALADLNVLGTGEGVPALEAVLAEVPDAVGVNIELKEPGLAKRVCTLISDIENEVVISSFHRDVLRAIRTECEAPRGYLTRWPAGLNAASNLECSFVHPRHTICSPAFVARARDAGVRVNAWTVADPGTARRLEQAGVDGLIADRSDILDTRHEG